MASWLVPKRSIARSSRDKSWMIASALDNKPSRGHAPAMRLCLLTHRCKYKARCSTSPQMLRSALPWTSPRRATACRVFFCQAPLLEITGADQVQHMLLAS